MMIKFLFLSLVIIGWDIIFCFTLVLLVWTHEYQITWMKRQHSFWPYIISDDFVFFYYYFCVFICVASIFCCVLHEVKSVWKNKLWFIFHSALCLPVFSSFHIVNTIPYAIQNWEIKQQQTKKIKKNTQKNRNIIENVNKWKPIQHE